ncbi:MAG: hypothetical protein ACQETB_00035 [Halobacteriota archaeon]
MTSNATEPPPAQKATDEEVLEALEGVTSGLDVPAVPTALVAAELPIARQTVKRRLDDLAEEGLVASLATGQGRIWWLPDGVGGYVDPAAIDRPIEEIDPYEIPPDVAREIAETRLPEFKPPSTVRERLRAWGTGRADDVVALSGLGVLLLVLPSTGLLEASLASIGLGIDLLDLGGLLLLAAALFVAVAAGTARLLAAIGDRAIDRGYADFDGDRDR